MDPKQAVQSLITLGMTQPEIVESLRVAGVETTQSTISRIGTGKFETTNFQLGKALADLAGVKQLAYAEQDSDAA